jgi:ABC-type transport system involved in multi-copper enzyme maturation permease subunit
MSKVIFGLLFILFIILFFLLFWIVVLGAALLIFGRKNKKREHLSKEQGFT